jgi:hypothetical protein
MKIASLASSSMVVWFVCVSVGHAEQLRYWGQPQPGAATGLIQLGASHYAGIEVGTEIPGWGRVTRMSDSYLVIEQVLTDAQRDALARQGAMVHDVLEIHVPREDQRRGQGYLSPLPTP